MAGSSLRIYAYNDSRSTYCQFAYDYDPYGGSKFIFREWTDSYGNIIDISDYPVIFASWYGAVAYCNWLSEQEGLTPAYDLDTWELKDSPENLEGYRVPMRNEWDYAAVGGANGYVTTYAGSNTLDEVGWYIDNSGVAKNSNIYNGKGTMPVGQKKANELGIYDMSGNVMEWTNTPGGYEYQVRGGSWYEEAEWCDVNEFSSMYHNYAFTEASTYGFRITRTK